MGLFVPWHLKIEIKIFDEKYKPKVKPRIDARNENYFRNGGDVEVIIIPEPKIQD